MRLAYQERQALGSRIQLALVVGDRQDEAPLFQQLWLELLLFEKRCSRFLPASELSTFNRAAGTRQPLSPEFRDILVAAQRMAHQTAGLYNPFVLPALQRSGYKNSLLPGHQTDDTDDFSDRRVVVADRLEVADTWARIPYGTAIDLGGCGKGYIGDVLAGQALQQKLSGFWFAIGGDVIAYGADEQQQPWTVYLQPDPKADQDQRIGQVAVPTDGLYAVATSTSLYRRGQQAGKAWHHIIDPRSGRPADSDITVATVCDGSLLRADVLASCLIIVGSGQAAELVHQHKLSSAAWLVHGKPGLQAFGASITAYAT
jgi:thiamine biosynthesis lipoprotein